MRITARGEQDTLLIIFLVKTRVGMTTNKAANAMLYWRFLRGRPSARYVGLDQCIRLILCDCREHSDLCINTNV